MIPALKVSTEPARGLWHADSVLADLRRSALHCPDGIHAWLLSVTNGLSRQGQANRRWGTRACGQLDALLAVGDLVGGLRDHDPDPTPSQGGADRTGRIRLLG